MELISAIIALCVFFLPSFIAFHRGHASRFAITVCNIFFGITVIGWGWCLIWALSNKGAQQTVIVNNHIGDNSVSNNKSN